MPDVDQESKTEKATAKRRSDELKKGNFPQAQEINITFVLVAGVLIVLMAGDRIAKTVLQTTAFVLGHLGELEFTKDSVSFYFNETVVLLGELSSPFLVGGMAAGIIAGGLQSRFRLTPKALTLKWSKLDPIKGTKNLVSKDTFVQFGVDLLKLAAMALILYMAVRKIVSDPIFYTPIDVKHVGVFIIDTVVFVLIRLSLAIGVIALINYLWKRHRNVENMKMTKDEVKQEKKDQDMSPELKSARMQMAMRLMQKQMLEEVPTADVVVTNPTHYAVALKYERGLDSAPVVLAKGENAFALRIKTVAAEYGVPVVENKIVARMLYKVAKVGSAIPVEMFQSVAEILAFVYKTHRYYFHKLKARRAAKRSKS